MHVQLSRPDEGAGRILAELDSSCGVAGWTEAGYRSVLSLQEWDSRIALIEGRPVGYYLSRLLPPEAELMAIGVVAEGRGAGVGKQLLEECLAEAVRRGCTSCFLEVRRSNRRAILFYQGNGFVTAYVREGYYADPREDALVLKRRLEKSNP